LVEAMAAVGEDVFLFCAGWKGHVNLEDTLFAGAVAKAWTLSGA